MPVYDYVCVNCGEVIEVVHGVHASGPERCARCGGTLRKALSAPAIVFKGSGWAKKDARSSARPATAKEGKPAADSSATDRPAKSTAADTKPAAD
jgi:putative FmdB family regulatory protein